MPSEQGSGAEVGLSDGEPPAGVTVRRGDGELSIELGAPGLRAAREELKFALMFAGVLVLLTGLFALLISGAGEATGDDPRIFMVAVAVGWVIAIGLLVDVVRRSRSRATLDVVGGTLLITTRMLGVRRTIEIEGDNIKALGVGPSGVVVDDQPVLSLRIDVGRTVKVGKKNRRKLKLLRERADEELHWLAAALREALGVKKVADPSWALDAASSSRPDRDGHATRA